MRLSWSQRTVSHFKGSLKFCSDIYRKVKNGQRPYFRPTLEMDSDDTETCSEELANMIKKCWSEEPMERPDFHSLKSIIRKINKSVFRFTK